jgi:hypothetical protein
LEHIQPIAVYPLQVKVLTVKEFVETALVSFVVDEHPIDGFQGFIFADDKTGNSPLEVFVAFRTETAFKKGSILLHNARKVD